MCSISVVAEESIVNDGSSELHGFGPRAVACLVRWRRTDSAAWQMRKGKQSRLRSRAPPAFYSLATFNSIDIHEVRITVFFVLSSLFKLVDARSCNEKTRSHARFAPLPQLPTRSMSFLPSSITFLKLYHVILTWPRCGYFIVFWKQYATINDDHVIAPVPTPYWFQGAKQRTAVEHPAAAELLAHASKPCGVVPITETSIFIFLGGRPRAH